MKFYVSIIAVFLLITSCKKEQPLIGEAKDPCDCLTEQRSTFFMGEKFGDQRIDLDTVNMPVFYADGDSNNFDDINDVFVYFESDYEDALSYTWEVGSNSTQIFDQSFGLFFQDTTTINVRLIVTSEPNTDCFPNDDGIDTVDRILTITNPSPHPLWGEYEGYLEENPSDIFTIEIDTLTRFFSFLTPPYNCSEVIKNLPQGKVNPVSIIRAFGSASYAFEGLGDVPPPYDDITHIGQSSTSIFNQTSRGLFNPETDEIRITYYTREIITSFQLGTDYTEHVFVGTKIQ